MILSMTTIAQALKNFRGLTPKVLLFSAIFFHCNSSVAQTTNSTVIAVESAVSAIAPNPISPQKIEVHRMQIQQVPAKYKFVSIPSTYVRDASWGFHYSNESMLKPLAWDVQNHYQSAGGWSTEILSGNKIKYKPLEQVLGAFYIGAGMGMGFYGSGNRYNVSLSTLRDDSAYTKLRSSSFTFYLKAQWEKAFGRFYPFITFAAGPRMFYTNQVVRTYAMVTDYETSTSHNILFSTSLGYEIAAGMKLRIGNRTYLYGSISQWNGNNISLQDLDHSTFNGLAFGNSVTHEINPNQWMYKMGIVFDLSADKTQKVEERAAYLDTSYVTDVYVVNNLGDSTISNNSTNSSNQQIRYLPCPCCDQNQPIYRKESSSDGMGYQRNGIDFQNNLGGFSSSPIKSNHSVIRSGSGSTGTRSPLPGVSAPISRPAIKTR